MSKYRTPNGWILKKDFCEKYGITINRFNSTMVNKGFLKRNMISTNLLNGKKKRGLGIGPNAESSLIRKKSGTWKQGTFLFKEAYFVEVFGATKTTKIKPEVDNYKNFIKYLKSKKVNYSEGPNKSVRVLNMTIWPMGCKIRVDGRNDYMPFSNILELKKYIGDSINFAKYGLP